MNFSEYTFSRHIKLRMAQRDITVAQVKECCLKGKWQVNSEGVVKSILNDLNVCFDPKTKILITTSRRNPLPTSIRQDRRKNKRRARKHMLRSRSRKHSKGKRFIEEIDNWDI